MLIRQRSIADEFEAWYTNERRHVVDPYPFFHRLRREAPIYRHGDLIVLSRYADCAAVVLNRDFWKTDGRSYDYGSLDPMSLPAAQQQRLRELFEMERLALNKTEGDQHSRLRRLVQRAFTPRMIETMRAQMEEVTEKLIDQVAPAGHMDAIADLAFQLPIIIISHMLDVPIEDRHQIRAWAMGITGLVGGVRDDVVGVVDSSHDNRTELFSYLRTIVNNRRSNGARRSSVMSTLLEAESEERLSDEELVANAALFVIAGHETTTNGIGNGIVALMTHPDQWELLCDDPSRAGSAADEALRYISPVQTEPRYASRTIELGGDHIRQGERLRLLLGAANRDPEQFEDPDRFDIGRTETKHLAFGSGHHYCLGAALAKQEIATALGALARRFPNMRMAEAQPRWRPAFNLRGVSELPLALGPDRG